LSASGQLACVHSSKEGYLMRGQQLLLLGGLGLLLNMPLIANQQDAYDQEEASMEATSTCEYWAAESNISSEEMAEYMESCVKEELAVYEDDLIFNNLSETNDESTVWE
jgi:hypothetical protein